MAGEQQEVQVDFFTYLFSVIEPNRAALVIVA